MIDYSPEFALFLSMVIQVIVPPLPAELIVIAAGRAYGVKMATIWAGAGLFTGSVIVYIFGRLIHQGLSRFFDREKTRQIVERIAKMETVLLFVRVLPYNPSDIISYGAGVIHVRPVKYVTITVCTSFVRVYLLSLLGTRLDSLKSILQIGALLVVSALIGSAVAYGKGFANRK